MGGSRRKQRAFGARGERRKASDGVTVVDGMREITRRMQPKNGRWRWEEGDNYLCCCRQTKGGGGGIPALKRRRGRGSSALEQRIGQNQSDRTRGRDEAGVVIGQSDLFLGFVKGVRFRLGERNGLGHGFFFFFYFSLFLFLKLSFFFFSFFFVFILNLSFFEFFNFCAFFCRFFKSKKVEILDKENNQI